MSAATTPAPQTFSTTGSTAGSTDATRMRAVVQDSYGGAEVLVPSDVPVPAIAPDEVLLRVHAAGLDRGTWHLMSGRPRLLRIMGFGLRRPKQRIAGIDACGTVVEVGARVTRFAVGDEVYGIARGSFAEYAAARERKLARKPADLTAEQAAVVPVSGLTALQAVLDAGRLRAGQSVLVIGASGGVGSYAVQVAKAAGGEVTGVASNPKLPMLRSLGADHVIDYEREDFADGQHRYDLIIDIAGNSPIPRLRRALTRTGTLVIVGGEGGGEWTGGFGRSLRAAALSPWVRHRLAMLVSKESGRDLERLTALIEAGSVRPHLDSAFTLEQVPEAMRRLGSGEVRGKVGIRIA
ncbi:NAD(P)-dependent alcohol dehydrogenase [Nocardioides gansuensis]|nr:NAD(P)-dependent alcohol dehydrogenase [Nocardioides gansuensis]